MDSLLCRCCLARPPDKDLKTSYKFLNSTEIYADMIEECFKIQMQLTMDSNENGICNTCVCQLRDAHNFKKQVQQCQIDLQKDDKLKVESNALEEPLAKKVKIENANFDENEVDMSEEWLSDVPEYFDIKAEPIDDEFDMPVATLQNIERLRLKTLAKKDKKNNKVSSKKRAAAGSKTSNVKTKTDKKSKSDLHALSPNLELKLKSARNKEALKKVLAYTLNGRAMNDMIKHQFNTETVLHYSNATPFADKNLAGYICAFCKSTHQDPQDLRVHYQASHKFDKLQIKKRGGKRGLSIKMDIKDLKCTLCDKKLDVIANLKKHLTKEHSVKFLSGIPDFIIEFNLTSTETLNCALCSSTFETFKMLHQHMNGHYSNFVCDICGQGYINEQRMLIHKRTHERGNFKCSFCEKEFVNRARKVFHEKYSHQNSERYRTPCPHCDATFTSYYQRNSHMAKEHNAAPASYKCNICNLTFLLKGKLTRHIKKVHLLERNHICAVCGKGFFQNQDLIGHMIRHNGERIYKCDVCDKAYARKKTLREHMRIHNNDRRFKCGLCGLAFVQKCSMKGHMLSNHGVTLAEFESIKLNTELTEIPGHTNSTASNNAAGNIDTSMTICEGSI